MPNNKPSIRKKIIRCFGALLVLITATAFVWYAIVHKVEGKLVFLEIVDALSNLASELRRHEKNYFLYRHDDDYKSGLEYIGRLDKVVSAHSEMFSEFLPSGGPDTIREILKEYQANLVRLHELHGLGGVQERLEEKQLEEEIRASGHRLTRLVETISGNEKISIKRLLRTSRAVLLASIGVLIVFSFVVAISLGKKIVSSLEILENYTKKIAAGEFITPPNKAAEEEIHSLFQAFNRMSNELRVRHNRMVQSEKLASLGTLLAGVAHELNNPLSNIFTSAQILGEEIADTVPEFHRKTLIQIGEQTEKARDIVRNLLEFSRTKEFVKEDVALRQLLLGTIQLLHSEMPSGIELEMDVPDNLHIWADRQRMQQLFLNLIGNAVDALGHEGNIWVSAGKVHPAARGGEVEILVSDNGPGIPQEGRKKIFDPFFTTKDVGKGSGLGLFVVHDIVQSHGGTICVDTCIDEGTTFIVWLPGGKTV